MKSGLVRETGSLPAMYHQMLKVDKKAKEVLHYRRSITSTPCASCWRARYAEINQTHGVCGDCLSGLDAQGRDTCNRRRLVLLKIEKMSPDTAETSSHPPRHSLVARFLRLLHQREGSAVVRRPYSHRRAVGLTLAVGVETGE